MASLYFYALQLFLVGVLCIGLVLIAAWAFSQLAHNPR